MDQKIQPRMIILICTRKKAGPGGDNIFLTWLIVGLEPPSQMYFLLVCSFLSSILNLVPRFYKIIIIKGFRAIKGDCYDFSDRRPNQIKILYKYEKSPKIPMTRQTLYKQIFLLANNLKHSEINYSFFAFHRW